mgnify:CR=1 FL=1
MTKPLARYQGVTERGATESVSPPPPRCNRRERPKKETMIAGETAAARLGSPHRLFFDTEDNCEQKLCQELLRQAGSCLRIGLLVDGSQMLLQHAE